jgi:lipopolysaccharide exporter
METVRPVSAETAATGSPSTGGLGKMLARAAFWSAANTALLRLGQLAISIVIARLVAPDEFGVFVVALTVYQIVISFSEFGVSTALVREVDNGDRIGPTVATIAIASSSALALLMFLSAPWISSALGAPAAADAVRVLAIPLLLAGPTAVPAALLARDFQQGRKMITDVTSFVVANGLLLVLAINGHGVMALAWSRVAGQVASAVLIFIVSTHNYRPGWNPAEARRLLRFGMPLAGANIAGFTLANVDFMVVGRLAGSTQLGYYNLAFTVSSWPPNIFTVILYSVTLPALARVKGGISEITRHVTAAQSALCAASFPVTTACVVLAQPLVTFVYGERWAPAAGILAVLAIFGSIRVIISLFSDVLVALDKTKRLFHLQLVWLAVLTPAMIAGVAWGDGIGAGVAQVAVALLVVAPIYLVVLVRSAGLPLAPLVRPAVLPLLAAVVAGVAAHFAAAAVGGALLKLGVGLLVLLVVYLLVLGRWLHRLVKELGALYGRKREPEADDSEPDDPEATMVLTLPTAGVRREEELL